MYTSLLYLPLVAYCGFCCFFAYRLYRDVEECKTKYHRKSTDIIAILASVLFIFVAKAPLLFISRPVQADESQYGANALLASDGWLNWDNLDSGSSGPLQSMSQAWPLAYGGDITYTTIHLTGIVLTCVIVITMYAVVRTRVGPRLSIVLCLPVILFLGGITHWDINHASSTLLPMVLTLFGTLAVARLLTAKSGDGPATTVMALSAAFALGLIPLVKPHAVMTGAYVGAALLFAYSAGAHSWPRRAVRAGLTIVAAILPLAMSLAGVLATGRWSDFTLEVFGYTEGYMPGEHSIVRAWLHAGWQFLKGGLHEPLLGTFYLIAILSYLYLAALWFRRWRKSSLFTIFALGLLALSVVTILMTGRGFLYYLLFVIPILPIPAAAVVAEARSAGDLGIKPNALLAVAGCVMLFLLPGVIWDAVNNPAIFADGALVQTGLRFTSPRILSFLVPSRDARLAVFGYMPQFYIDAQMRPATRETSSENMIMDRPRRADYRRRYLKEFDRNAPAIFIDAINKGSFVYVDPVHEGIATFPGLQARVDANYERVSAPDPTATCAEIYLRNDWAAKLKARLAPIASVKASGTLSGSGGAYGPSKVVDRRVFEDCPDRWLGPKRQPAWIELRLTTKTPVSKVALLNTRGVFRPAPDGQYDGYGNQVRSVAALQSAWHADVLLLSGQTIVARRHVTVRPYPYWTNLAFPGAPETTAVRITLPDWHGQGAGLNEIVISRPPPTQVSRIGDQAPADAVATPMQDAVRTDVAPH